MIGCGEAGGEEVRGVFLGGEMVGGGGGLDRFWWVLNTSFI